MSLIRDELLISRPDEPGDEEFEELRLVGCLRSFSLLNKRLSSPIIYHPLGSFKLIVPSWMPFIIFIACCGSGKNLQPRPSRRA